MPSKQCDSSRTDFSGGGYVFYMATAFSEPGEASVSQSNQPLPAYRVRVPASTSNCGPGFDTLGLAFDLYNEVTLQKLGNSEIRYVGKDQRVQGREVAMVSEVAEKFFAAAGVDSFGFTFDIEGEVPAARGLGSSVTVRAGIIGGLNAIAGFPLDKHEIARIITALEGHPDNAVAAVFGGFCVARTDPKNGRFVDLVKIDVPDDLLFAVVSPDLEIKTDDSRKTLPEELAFSEVVKSLNSLAYLVSVFAKGEYEKLRGAVTDFIHQPYRLPQLPGAEAAIAAGVAAGAYAGWLSGSGSTVVCVAPAESAVAVGAAMEAVFAESNVRSHSQILRCDNEGLHVGKA